MVLRKKKKMSKVKYDGWVLKGLRDFLFVMTFRWTRKDLIESCEKNMCLSWKGLRKLGYKAVKVRVVEVEEK